MSAPIVFLICGVSGSGKTWACKNQNDFNYVPHDAYFNDISGALSRAHSLVPDLPLLTECPFAERPLRDELTAAGFEVRPYFVVEQPNIVAARYLKRENKAASKSTITRATTILDRAKEWNSPWGTSEQIRVLLATEGVTMRKMREQR